MTRLVYCKVSVRELQIVGLIPRAAAANHPSSPEHRHEIVQHNVRDVGELQQGLDQESLSLPISWSGVQITGIEKPKLLDTSLIIG